MKTWRKYRTYTRVKRLWQEYKEVAQAELTKSDGRLVLVSQKLSIFLEAFQSAYTEFKSEFDKPSSKSSSLQAFYGDCSELLLSLLEIVDHHNLDDQAAPEEAQEQEEAAASGRASPGNVNSKLKGIVEKASKTVDAKLVDNMRQSTEKLTTHAGAVIKNPENMKMIEGWTRQATDPEVAYHIAETVNKALGVAELIISEDKYRGIATVDAPQVTRRLLSLLENVKTPEAKRLALRMIGFMAQSMESRLEFCRLDGYRKVLQVLRESPDQITMEAVTTLSHLIEAHDSEAAAADADAPERLKQVIENAASRSQSMRLNLSLQPSAIWNTTKAAVARAQLLVGSDRPHGQQNSESGDGVDPEEGGECGSGGGAAASVAEFPPSRISVARRMEEVEIEVRELFEMQPSALETNLTPRSFADYLASEHMQGDGLDDDLMKEIMGVQGALTALTSKLAEAARDVKLDLMATISKLLRNSKRNQLEFRNIDGYTLLRQIIDSISDYSSPASQMFLRDLFGIFQSIIVDATSERSVALDVLQLDSSIPSHANMHAWALACMQMCTYARTLPPPRAPPPNTLTLCAHASNTHSHMHVSFLFASPALHPLPFPHAHASLSFLQSHARARARAHTLTQTQTDPSKISMRWSWWCDLSALSATLRSDDGRCIVCTNC